MIKIEKNIPIPTSWSRVRKYPFNDMDVGDSIFVPVEGNSRDERIMNRVTSSVRQYSSRTGHKFTTRTQRDETGNVTGIRVWRIK